MELFNCQQSKSLTNQISTQQAAGLTLFAAVCGVMSPSYPDIKMKYIVFVIALISVNTYSCIAGPKQLEASEKYGFVLSESPSKYDDSTTEISIIAPLTYEKKEFDIGIFTVSFNGNVVSKSIHSSKNEEGAPEFIGYVSNSPGFKYSVSFLYGEGRCKTHEFTATNERKKS